MGYLLDTNIVTAILKDNQVVVEKLSEVRLQGNDVFISCITYLLEFRLTQPATKLHSLV